MAQYATNGFKIPQTSFELVYLNIPRQLAVLPFIFSLYGLKFVDT